MTSLRIEDKNDISRLPVRSGEYITAFVNKLLKYEKIQQLQIM